MNNVISAISRRDGDALARIAGNGQRSPDRGVNPEIEKLVDVLFANLKPVRPASVSTIFKSPEAERAAKRQWIFAFVESGITSKAQLSVGMKRARANPSPFWPSTGEFIEWCKEGELNAAGLMSVDELFGLVMQYCKKRGDYSSPVNYPWNTGAEYLLVTGLYSAMRAECLSEDELRKRCKRDLAKMSDRLRAGEQIPMPTPLIESKTIVSTPAVAQSHLAKMRQMLKHSKAQ